MPAKEFHRHVRVRYVHEPARPDADVLESPPVGGEGSLAVHPGGDVAIVRGREVLLRDQPEVEHIDSFFRGTDRHPGELAVAEMFHAASIRRPGFLPARGAGFPTSRGKQQRTPGQIAQEAATIRG